MTPIFRILAAGIIAAATGEAAAQTKGPGPDLQALLQELNDRLAAEGLMLKAGLLYFVPENGDPSQDEDFDAVAFAVDGPGVIQIPRTASLIEILREDFGADLTISASAGPPGSGWLKQQKRCGPGDNRVFIPWTQGKICRCDKRDGAITRIRQHDYYKLSDYLLSTWDRTQ